MARVYLGVEEDTWRYIKMQPSAATGPAEHERRSETRNEKRESDPGGIVWWFALGRPFVQ